MTHHNCLGEATDLSSITALSGAPDYHRILRVVQVNEDTKLALPAHEIWAGYEPDPQNIQYLIFEANSLYDTTEDFGPLEQANEVLRSCGWLRSLSPMSDIALAGTGRWYTTHLVRYEPNFWEKNDTKKYTIHEAKLRLWLERGAKPAEEFDDEENWACQSCGSFEADDTEMEEKPTESERTSEEGEEMQDVEMPDADLEDDKEEPAVAGTNKKKASLGTMGDAPKPSAPNLVNDRWAKDADAGYEGEVERTGDSEK